MTYTASFLDNPRGRKRKAPRARKVASEKRKTRRPPPKGWDSWKSYMASIRPNPAGAHKRTTKHKGATVATKKKAKKRSEAKHDRKATRRDAVTKRNPPRRAQRRGGIMASVRELPQHAIHGVVSAAEAIGGKVVVRGLRAKVTKEAPGTVVASAWEVLIAIFGGALLAGFNENLGTMFTVGGLMAPAESALQGAGIPFVSSSLGDDGFLVGPGTGVMLVSAHPGDYASAAGVLPSGAEASDIGSMSDYVTGTGQSGELADYVTGGQMADYVNM